MGCFVPLKLLKEVKAEHTFTPYILLVYLIGSDNLSDLFSYVHLASPQQTSSVNEHKRTTGIKQHFANVGARAPRALGSSLCTAAHWDRPDPSQSSDEQQELLPKQPLNYTVLLALEKLKIGLHICLLSF